MASTYPCKLVSASSSNCRGSVWADSTKEFLDEATELHTHESNTSSRFSSL